jgi:DivIVA domain-containing protein
MGQLLTPDDIRKVSFRKPPIGRRGYDEEEVDAFLDVIEGTITALYDEIARLRSGAAAPAFAAAPTATSGGDLPGDLAQIKATLARIEAAVNRGMPGGNSMF